PVHDLFRFLGARPLSRTDHPARRRLGETMTTAFRVVPGAAVNDILSSSRELVLKLVEQAYLIHDDGDSVNPDSYFLRFPAKPTARMIALPAYLGGSVDRIGTKWIASFPDNIRTRLPRASAALLLHDYQTGYPVACL